MKTVVLTTLSFAVCRALPGLLLSLALFLQSAPRPDAVGDFLLVLYLASLSASLCGIGFLIPTGLSAGWRRVTVRRGMAIAAALGVLAPVATLLVAAVTARALLPLFRNAIWIASALFHGLPGAVLGAAAVVIANGLARRDARRRATN